MTRVQSSARPMVIGASASVIFVPARAPAVTSNWRAARPRLTFAGRAPPTAGPTPRGAATSRLERAPANRSRRTTPTTVNTKIHNRTRNPYLATVRTISGMQLSIRSLSRGTPRAGSLPVGPERQRRGAELDHVTRVQRDGGHALAVDHRSVGRAEVGEYDLRTVEVEPGMAPRDAHVGQSQVGLVTAPDHGRADRERVAATVTGDQPRATGLPAAALRRWRALRSVRALVVGWVTGRRFVGRDRCHVATGVDLGGDPEHARVQAVTALDLDDDVAIHGPALLADELGLRLGQLLGERGGVGREPAVVVW